MEQVIVMVDSSPVSAPDLSAFHRALAERLSAARQRFHGHCGGEVIGNACMRCGSAGVYQWTIGSGGKPAVTPKAFPIVHFVTEG
jgi:hypothetical protein